MDIWLKLSLDDYNNFEDWYEDYNQYCDDDEDIKEAK